MKNETITLFAIRRIVEQNTSESRVHEKVVEYLKRSLGLSKFQNNLTIDDYIRYFIEVMDDLIEAENEDENEINYAGSYAVQRDATIPKLKELKTKGYEYIDTSN